MFPRVLRFDATFGPRRGVVFPPRTPAVGGPLPGVLHAERELFAFELEFLLSEYTTSLWQYRCCVSPDTPLEENTLAENTMVVCQTLRDEYIAYWYPTADPLLQEWLLLATNTPELDGCLLLVPAQSDTVLLGWDRFLRTPAGSGLRGESPTKVWLNVHPKLSPEDCTLTLFPFRYAQHINAVFANLPPLLAGSLAATLSSPVKKIMLFSPRTLLGHQQPVLSN